MKRNCCCFWTPCSAGTFAPAGFKVTSAFWKAFRAANPFLPDGISMAKSLGGGFPIGAFWVRQPYADLLGAGSHGTTFGGSPLACAVALKILEVIQQEKLADNARETGAHFQAGLRTDGAKNIRASFETCAGWA